MPDIPSVPDQSEPGAVHGNGARPYRGVILDWGGVMTNPIREMVKVWLDDEDVDVEHYAGVMRPWVIEAYEQNGDINPIHALERGECTTPSARSAPPGCAPGCCPTRGAWPTTRGTCSPACSTWW